MDEWLRLKSSLIRSNMSSRCAQTYSMCCAVGKFPRWHTCAKCWTSCSYLLLFVASISGRKENLENAIILVALLAEVRAKRDGAMSLQIKYREGRASLGNDLAK